MNLATQQHVGKSVYFILNPSYSFLQFYYNCPMQQYINSFTAVGEILQKIKKCRKILSHVASVNCCGDKMHYTLHSFEYSVQRRSQGAAVGHRQQPLKSDNPVVTLSPADTHSLMQGAVRWGT